MICRGKYRTLKQWVLILNVNVHFHHADGPSSNITIFLIVNMTYLHSTLNKFYKYAWAYFRIFTIFMKFFYTASWGYFQHEDYLICFDFRQELYLTEFKLTTKNSVYPCSYLQRI